MTNQNHPRHPLDMNGKPMHDWYYTRDGLCRPVPYGTAPAEAYKDYCEFLLDKLDSEKKQSDAEPDNVAAARQRIRECNAWHDCQQCSDDERLIAQFEAQQLIAEFEALSKADHR